MNYLKDKDFRLMLLLFVAGILIINLCTILVVDSSQARSYTYVAITFGSLLLSLIAIFVSIWQYGSQRGNESVLNSQIERLSEVAEDIRRYTPVMLERISKTATRDDVKEIYESGFKSITSISSEQPINRAEPEQSTPSENIHISASEIFADAHFPSTILGLKLLAKVQGNAGDYRDVIGRFGSPQGDDFQQTMLQGLLRTAIIGAANAAIDVARQTGDITIRGHEIFLSDDFENCIKRLNLPTVHTIHDEVLLKVIEGP